MTWTRNLISFLRQGHKMEEEEKKTCFDCLHCKVSAKSTSSCRLCFCLETGEKEMHKEPYWQEKPVCEKFSDMGA